ncbi:RodZ domain-containing protein [Thermodesulfobium sp. 4217-1]|uniref:helix-turn-helix domain-containing protein n=1 Tax=Thermodesulfobium sp. 4217-1 TaxID=3120013 RepID=UPI00322146A0
MDNHSQFPELLKSLRSEKGLSIDDLAEQSKIFSYYLKIFEEGKKESFPPYSICKGYIKAIARELDTEPTLLLKAFDDFFLEKKDHPPVEKIVVSNEKREKILKERNIKSIKYVIATLIVLIIVSLSVFFIYHKIVQKNVVVNKAPAGVVTQEKPTNVVPQANSQKTIYLKFIGKSWVLVKDKDKVLFEGVINPGEEKTFQTNDTLDIKLGNAGGVEISKDGISWVKAGNVGEVVELNE